MTGPLFALPKPSRSLAGLGIAKMEGRVGRDIVVLKSVAIFSLCEKHAVSRSVSILVTVVAKVNQGL